MNVVTLKEDKEWLNCDEWATFVIVRGYDVSLKRN
jgi:hypothetical protein